MLVCPECGYSEETLKWFKKGDNYHANSRHDGLKYKIEKETNLMWFYYTGAKTHKVKLPVVFNVNFCEEGIWKGIKGCATLAEAKEYCEGYEN